MQKQLLLVLKITIAWILVSLIQYFIGLAIIIDMGLDLTGKDLMVPFWGSIFTGILAGILGGSMLVFGWRKWLRSQPYGIAIRNIVLSYLLIFYIVAIPSSCYFNSKYTGLALTDIALWLEVLKALASPTLLVPLFFWLIVNILTIITFLVDDKYGPGVFKKFLLGKYFMPSREERIFMFLDLKNSTTIAEQLGEEKYFHFIRDTFKKITPAITNNHAEDYQYVGDEIVLSWNVKKGIKNSMCIDLFFECKELLLNSESYFNSRYGVKPTFKAGMHYGYVMAGEIGVIKREIAYSGDVLNTTARIQEMCNELEVDILLSESLSDQIKMKEGYEKLNKGTITLRGKMKDITLCTVIPRKELNAA